MRWAGAGSNRRPSAFRGSNVPVQAAFAEVRQWSTGACVGLWQGPLSSTLSSTKPSVREAIDVRERLESRVLSPARELWDLTSRGLR